MPRPRIRPRFELFVDVSAAQTWQLERELQTALHGHGPRLVDGAIEPRARGFR